MRLLITFLILPFLCFSQRITSVEFSGSIKDRKKTIKSFTVIDKRVNQDLGTILYKNKSYHFELENKDLKKSFEYYFHSFNNNLEGTKNLVLLLEDLKFLSGNPEGLNMPNVNIKISMFVHKDSNYYFLNRLNKIIYPIADFPKSPSGISLTFANRIATFIKNSFE